MLSTDHFELPLRPRKPSFEEVVLAPPVVQVLSITELLQCILDFCDARTLVACARVNSEWFECAIKALWRGETKKWEFDTQLMPYANSIVPYPSVWQLQKLPPGRLKFYLKNARLFLLHTHNCQDDNQVRLPDWSMDAWQSFHGKALRLDSDTAWRYLMKDDGYLRLIHPGLRILQCPRSWTANCTPILQAIRNNAPKLSWLQLRLSRPQAEPSSTASFITTLQTLAPHLTALQIAYDPSVSEQILPAIFALPNLALLTLDEFGSGPSTIPQITWTPDLLSSTSPLRHLRARITNEALTNLLPNLPHLHDLELVFSSPAHFTHDILSTISTAHSLRHLNIQVDPESYIPPEAVTNLTSSLPHLREFLLHCGKQGRLSYLTPWPRGTIKRITSPLQNLDKLRLEYNMEVDTSELIALATSCPRIREIRLSADIHLKPLTPLPTQNPPLFPYLEVLRLDHILYSRRPLMTEYFKPCLEDIAERHMPRLHTLGNFGPDAHDYDTVNLGVRGTPGLRLPGKRWMKPPRRVSSVGDEIFRDLMDEPFEEWTRARAADDGMVSYRVSTHY